MKGPHRHLLRFGREIRAVGVHVDRRSFLRYCTGIAIHAPEIVRSHKLVAADAAMAHHEVRVRFDSAQLRVPGEYFGLVRELLCRKVYQLRPGFAPRRGDVVVDLGANVGVFSVSAAAAGARVVAVEAQVGFVWELERLAALNDVSGRVQAIHALVGETTGVLAGAEGRRRASHTFDREPPVMTVDQVLAMASVERVSLMKIDIEGSEFALLRDDPPWLDRVARVVLEVHAQYGRPPAVAAALKRRGFSIEAVDGGGRAVQVMPDRDCFLFAHR